jgi:hypothetical protein
MADKEAPPFEVELHLAGGVVVPFKLYEEGLRHARHPAVAAAAQKGGRENTRSAAVTVAEDAILRNGKGPITVEDGDTLWIIPTATVMAVRFRDPTIKGQRGAFGFSADRLGD